MLKKTLKKKIVRFVFLFISFAGSLFLILNAVRPVSAATINVATVASAGGANGSAQRQTPQRKIVTSSNGTIFDFYSGAAGDAGASSSAGVNFRKSTDSGVTWTDLSGANQASQVAAVSTNDISVAIDNSDNIWVVYTNGGISLREITYSGGVWTIPGSDTKTWANTCSGGVGNTYLYPVVSINTSGDVLVAMRNSCGSNKEADDYWNTSSWRGAANQSGPTPSTNQVCPLDSVDRKSVV